MKGKGLHKEGWYVEVDSRISRVSLVKQVEVEVGLPSCRVSTPQYLLACTFLAPSFQ